MILRFTKGTGKYDQLAITRADGGKERIDCPKQGIIPHDMVHYAVESVLCGDGFLSRVGAGEALAFAMAYRVESEAIERLVETIQADAWGGGASPPADLIALYDVACAARGHPAPPVDEPAIAAIRALMADLGAQWQAVPVGGTMTLTLAN